MRCCGQQAGWCVDIAAGGPASCHDGGRACRVHPYDGCPAAQSAADPPRLSPPNDAHWLLPRAAGIFTGLAIALHNIPEGLATFVGALNDTKVGASIAAAIAIHNVRFWDSSFAGNVRLEIPYLQAGLTPSAICAALRGYFELFWACLLAARLLGVCRWVGANQIRGSSEAAR